MRSYRSSDIGEIGPRRYPCSFLPSSNGCKHGGNKVFDWGFAGGTAGYCRLKEKWTRNMEKCPLLELIRSENSE